MDIKTLRYFVTVVEELNISRAAEKLNMSQPPLSAQIQNLERELETTLLIRGKRGLKVTESGRLLYRRAKEILSLVEKAESEILSMSKGMGGTISLGLVEGTAPDIAGSWFSGFYKMHPKVRFHITDGSTDDLLEKMRSGLISLAVITAPCDNSLLNSFSVGKEPMVALMNRNHPLAGIESGTVSIGQLAGEPLIVPSRKAVVDRIYKWFRETGDEPNIVCEMDSYLDAAALAGKEMGISLFPQTAYVPNTSLVSKRIEGADRFLEYLFVWRKGHPLPTVEEHFIDYVKECTFSSETESQSERREE